MDITLEKIDIIRDRTGVSYREAKTVLEKHNGNVVEALIDLEEGKGTWKEEINVKGTEIIDKVKEIIRKGNVTKLKVKQGNQVLLDIPVTAGAIGVLIGPQLAALGVIAALVTKCSIEIERSKDSSIVVDGEEIVNDIFNEEIDNH